MEALINAIKDVIKANGNEEITGPVLQTILISMVNNLSPDAFGSISPTNQGSVSGSAVYAELYGARYDAPTATYVDERPWNNSLTANIAYADDRCIVPANSKVSLIKISAYAAGTAELVIMDTSTKQILESIPITLTVGINTLSPIIGVKSYGYILGIKNGAVGRVSTIFPATGNTHGWKNEAGVVTAMTYEVAIQVMSIQQKATTGARLDILEDYVGIGIIGQSLNSMIQSKDSLNLGNQTYIIDAPINIPSGRTIKGQFGKTKIQLAPGVTQCFNIDNKQDVEISGMEIIGNLPNYSYDLNGIVDGSGYTNITSVNDAIALTGMPAGYGIRHNACERLILQRLKIRNIEGFAIKGSLTGKLYIWGANFNDLFISNAWGGIKTDNEHEFSQYNNYSITLCQVGIHSDSGNLVFGNGHITRGRVGMVFTNGLNHAHGVAGNLMIKHNKLGGLICKDLLYGQTFGNLDISFSAENVRFDNCTGISISTLRTTSGTVFSSGTGKNVIGVLMLGPGGSVSGSAGLEIVKQVTY